MSDVTARKRSNDGSTSTLEVSLRTPHREVYKAGVRSLRVPTPTGQVGLRPRSEKVLLPIDPGLILIHTPAGGEVFIATLGGLLRCDGKSVVILTPLASAGVDRAALLKDLDEAISDPNKEMAVRRILDKLESDVLAEMQRGVSMSNR